MVDLPTRLDVPGAEFVRIDAPEPIACWNASIEPAGDGRLRSVSVIMDPVGRPGEDVLRLAGVVVARFDEFTGAAAEYLRQRLREPEYGLSGAELLELQRAEPPFGAPEAVLWSDGSWMLRFAESRLALADPYGIGVLFEGTSPCGVDDFSEVDSV